MAMLITLQGPEGLRRYPLESDRVILGRQFDCTICLSGQAVSRQHAQLLRQADGFAVEDLDSSNGTFVNGVRLEARKPTLLQERDTLQIGPYLFCVRMSPRAAPEPNLVVRETMNPATLQQSLLGQDASSKLQVVLEIAQNLGRTLDLEPLLDKLLEQLMRLFPQADRALVVLCEGQQLVERAQRVRGLRDVVNLPFSRTIVRRALEEGVGLWSEDVQSDQRFQSSQTLTTLGILSMLCAPMITPEGKRLGVLQVDRLRPGQNFRRDDLQLLATVGLQVAVVLENADLHAQRLREERLMQELALAREIQQGYLPQRLEGFEKPSFEVLGRVYPARQVAGDLYDYFRMPDGRLAFFIGDVSGKGMPAALFMVAARTLIRHLAKEPGSPGRLLERLNEALSADNPSCMFITLVAGSYDPESGEVALSIAGHPPPVLRRADGTVEEVAIKPGRLLGYPEGELHLVEKRFTLAPADTLVFYTDGLREARAPDRIQQFGLPRILEMVRGFTVERSLSAWADGAKRTLEEFTGGGELQDDLTMLLLRRTPPGDSSQRELPSLRKTAIQKRP